MSRTSVSLESTQKKEGKGGETSSLFSKIVPFVFQNNDRVTKEGPTLRKGKLPMLSTGTAAEACINALFLSRVVERGENITAILIKGLPFFRVSCEHAEMYCWLCHW